MLYASELRRLIKNKQVHNFGFLFSIQASNILISLVTIPITIQAIGVEQLGLVDLSLSIIYTLGIVVSYGYNLSAPREVALRHFDKKALSYVFSKVISSKLVIALLLTFLLLLLLLFNNLPGTSQLILIFSIVILFSEALFPHWLAQGLEKMTMVALGNLGAKVIYLLLLLQIVKTPQDSFLVNFLLGISGIAANSLLILYILRHWQIEFVKVRLSEIWSSLKENFSLFIYSVAGYITVNSGIMILSFFASDYMLGAYSLAERVVRVVRLVPSIIVQAIYPRASRLFVEDKAAFFTFIRKAFLLALLASLFVSLTTVLFAPLIVRVLSGQNLQDSTAVLQILGFVPFLACLNIGNIMLLLVGGHNGVLLKSAWISFVLMAALCVWFSWHYGAIGLALGLLLTECAIFFVQLFFNLIYLPGDTKKLYALPFGSRHHN